MLGGKPKECEGCKAKDRLIAQYEKMLDGSHQTILSIVDREAMRARYPQAHVSRRSAAPAQEAPESASTPSRGIEGLRLPSDPGTPWEPPTGASHAEIEAAFLLNAREESLALDQAAAELEAARLR